MENKKDKRVLEIELDDNVRKVSITGLDSDEKVVMKEDLDESDLEQVTGAILTAKCPNHYSVSKQQCPPRFTLIP